MTVFCSFDVIFSLSQTKKNPTHSIHVSSQQRKDGRATEKKNIGFVQRNVRVIFFVFCCLSPFLFPVYFFVISLKKKKWEVKKE